MTVRIEYYYTDDDQVYRIFRNGAFIVSQYHKTDTVYCGKSEAKVGGGWTYWPRPPEVQVIKYKRVVSRILIRSRIIKC